jgi:hypothetical protein
MISLRQRMIEDMQVRNLSVHTQKCYVLQVSLFARHFNKSPDKFRASPRPTAFYLVPRKRSTISGSIGSTASV